MNNHKLTAIRGVACIVVAIGHSIGIFDMTPGLSDYTTPFGSQGAWMTLHQLMMMLFSGEAAVVVFFVLSGCVLTIQIERLEASDPVPFRSYYVRRFLRIYPMVFASVLIAGGVLVLLQQLPAVRSLPVSWMSYLDQASCGS